MSNLQSLLQLQPRTGRSQEELEKVQLSDDGLQVNSDTALCESEVVGITVELRGTAAAAESSFASSDAGGSRQEPASYVGYIQSYQVVEVDGNSCKIITHTPYNDGHQWRKYGEKRINGFTFSRCYYRCSYKEEQDCTASKQVQQMTCSLSPTFLVIYKEKHTCDAATTIAFATTRHLFVDSPRTEPFLIRFDSNDCETKLQKKRLQWTTNSIEQDGNQEEQSSVADDDQESDSVLWRECLSPSFEGFGTGYMIGTI